MNNLNENFIAIKSCKICPSMDHFKSLRKIEAVNLNSDVFIISQSLAKEQLRLSGINFFNNHGIIGNTGRNLEKFLNKFQRTVYPPVDAYTLGGFLIKKKTEFISIYNTEITQCYPGKNNKGDRPPTDQEIKNCIDQNFLINEISNINPKVIFLMGNSSYKSFFKYFLKESKILPLSDFIEKLSLATIEIPTIIINNIQILVIPIQHASGANPKFYAMLKNGPFINVLKNILNNSKENFMLSEYDRVWDELAKLPINKDNEVPQMCENEGELWQFMGTYLDDNKKLVHQFRHRCHPKTSDRIYINIPANRELKNGEM